MRITKCRKLVPLLASSFLVSFLPFTPAIADEIIGVPVFPSTYVDSQNYDLIYVYDTDLRDPQFAVEVTANSISLRGVSGFEDVKSILWKVLDENNNELFWRGNDDDDNLDMRDSVNEYLYNSIGTTPLTTYDGEDLDGVTPLPSFAEGVDEGSESIIRSCENTNYSTPGTTEIPGRFEANTEYRIYMAIYADNPATNNCAEVFLDDVIFTGIYTNQHDITWESTATTLDITVSNWDPSVVEDFAFVLCDSGDPLEDDFTKCINAPPYDIDSNDDDVIDHAEFFASDYEDWESTNDSQTISFVDLEPSTNYDFYIQFFELVGSSLILMENYSLTEGIPYEEAIEATALYSLSTSAAPPPSSPGGGSSGGSGTPPILPQLSAAVTQLVLTDPSKLKDSYFKSLDANQLGSISVSQFAKLPVKTLKLLTPIQVSALTFDQLKGLKPSQVVALKPAVIAVLNSTQIAALQPADFKLMKTAQIARINGEAAAGLAKSDLNSFSRTQLRSLNTKAVKGLKPVVLKSLSVNKLRQFSPRQIRSLTDEQKSFLTKTQKRSLRIK